MLRFNSQLGHYKYNKEVDFVGRGEMGTAVRAFKYGNFDCPVVLKIIEKSQLTSEK